MLADILEKKKCFKLVCGAGNEDVNEVEKLVYLYAMSGASLFDLSANIEIIKAAKKSIIKAEKITGEKKYICVSYGIPGDPHIRKAQIESANCSKCGLCIKICPNNAIINTENGALIEKYRCLGCGKCEDICKSGLIKFYSEAKSITQTLPEILKEGIDCVELHAISENETEAYNNWNEIISLHKGMVSLCLDRSEIGNKKLVARIKKFTEKRDPWTTIIQADGSPMSGGKDDYKSTLQAVSTAEIVANANLPLYIILSGGTNSKSSELAKICGINIHGVGIGSFARQIVKDEIKTSDFFENKIVFENALKKSKKLVYDILKHLY